MNLEKYPFLKKVDYPEDFRHFNIEELKGLSNDVREYLIDTLSEVGGHFASNLGVVELTVALHYVFNTPRDKLIWDVGHQIYPHKILTGRKHRLRSVRRFGGLSGFPKREESEYDLYNTGHAGTSISQLLGEAIARDLKGEDYKCIAVIGDASIGCGMAFEALNHGGHIKTDCIVILNDNDMSISKNVGALNSYLNKLVTSKFYNKSKKLWYKFVYWLPILGPALKLFSLKFEKALKDFFLPGSLFEDFGFRYIGPIDGHNIEELVEVLDKVKNMKGPILLHVYTQKGKGFKPAEKNPIQYHSVSQFNRIDGTFVQKNKNETISFSNIVGNTLIDIFEKNPKAVAITPAMIEGSGLRKLYEKFPDRVFDVGIAEQHALTFAGGLASGGLIPYMCIYSTFLNRAIDQLIQDIALMNLPVKLVIDRGGCVGPDGETHQGLYDLGYLYAIPNIRIFAPSNGAELKQFLYFMEKDNQGPIAVRFPKAEEPLQNLDINVDIHNIKPEIIKSHNTSEFDIGIISIGIMKNTGLEVQEKLKKSGISSILIALKWVRPFAKEFVEELLSNVNQFIFIEDSYEFASASMAILEQLSSQNKGKHLRTFAFPSEPIEHGTRSEIFDKYNISSEKITNYLINYIENHNKIKNVI
ncbi:MAG: 1-deoxy-D-xylulose-5-phosphate synthase [Leptospiraceae bacterium]|nr:MAG: 1-deoxy-D-xylulose-5-phosphate synthase [Leptospiraceae bacterium]